MSKSPHHRDTCTPTFTAPLFTVTRIWSQAECPSADRKVKKMLCIHAREFDLAVTKTEMMKLAGT